MKYLSSVFFIVTALALASCSAPKPGSPEAIVLQQKTIQDQKNQQALRAVEEMPEWFLNPPVDGVLIHATGTNRSTDLQMSMDKALQDAKASLADKLQGMMSGKMKQFLGETGVEDNVELVQEAEKVTNSIFVDVNMAGYRVVERKVLPDNGVFRTYILVSYAVGDANNILVEQIKKNTILNSKIRASKAYSELEGEMARVR